MQAREWVLHTVSVSSNMEIQTTVCSVWPIKDAQCLEMALFESIKRSQQLPRPLSPVKKERTGNFQQGSAFKTDQNSSCTNK